MKALSIRQPWAWLIVNGYKAIENRDWNTKFRGQFLIHAGLKIDASAFRWLAVEQPEIYRKMPAMPGFQKGGIVGACDLTNVVHEKDSHLLTARDKPWFFGEYGFVLDNPRPLAFIPVKGQLGFFEVPQITNHTY